MTDKDQLEGRLPIRLQVNSVTGFTMSHKLHCQIRLINGN